MSLKPPTLQHKKTLFKNEFLSLQEEVLKRDDLSYSYYSLTTKPFSVVILAIALSGEVILIKEYRHPTKQILLACPGGFLEKEEDVLTAARRELLEETGYQATNFMLLGSAYPYPGMTGQKTFYIHAIAAEYQQPPLLETSEMIEVSLLPLEVLEKKIFEGAEVDGNLCIALFLLRNQPGYHILSKN